MAIKNYITVKTQHWKCFHSSFASTTQNECAVYVWCCVQRFNSKVPKRHGHPTPQLPTTPADLQISLKATAVTWSVNKPNGVITATAVPCAKNAVVSRRRPSTSTADGPALTFEQLSHSRHQLQVSPTYQFGYLWKICVYVTVLCVTPVISPWSFQRPR